MKNHSKSEQATKSAPAKKQNEISPIEIHLMQAAEKDRLHKEIYQLETKIAHLLQKRAELVAEL
jgi:hypothetical protein